MSAHAGQSRTPASAKQAAASNRAGTVAVMAGTNDDDFDQWVADQGGPEAVAAIVADVRQQVQDGTLPGFTDQAEFLAHLRRRDRRSA